MTDSQTEKKLVMLAGRVPAIFKKRLAIACAHRGWKVQDALQIIIGEWLEAAEIEDAGGRRRGGAEMTGPWSGAAVHDEPKAVGVRKKQPRAAHGPRSAR